MSIEKEDYQEPRCPLDMNGGFGRESTPSLPMGRIVEKLDAYCARRDFEGALRHLDYWLAEARANRDYRGEFSMQNERMGFFRKQGRRAEALAAADAALSLLDAAGRESIGAGTCYVNVGTVYDTFDQPADALPYFEKARAIYEKELPPRDPRLGGLYNNMALALSGVGRFPEARQYFRRALDAVEGSRYGAWEQAVTWLNLADTATAEKGAEDAETEVAEYLQNAAALLDGPEPPRDAYYAFICEKCAPCYDYHGWFAYAGELRERAEKLYAGA